MSVPSAATLSLLSGNKYVEGLSAYWKKHVAKRSDDAPTVISTFAGAGGSSLGYSMAGYKELLAVEWNPDAANTFRANFSLHGVGQYVGDIHDLAVKDVLKRTGLKKGELDLFDGSPPCQGFSTNGKRDPNDPRNQLFREFVRLLRGLQPRVFVMENVYGLVKGHAKTACAEILAELRASGYTVQARVLNAMYYGVPHSRSRVIFIGVRKDIKKEIAYPDATTPEPITVAMALRGIPKDEVTDTHHTFYKPNKPKAIETVYAAAKRAKQGESYRHTLRRDIWNRPAWCLTTGCGTASAYLNMFNCHPLYTRIYSPLEYQLLGSFPIEFDFSQSGKTPLYKTAYLQIGNCVPPLFMYNVAKKIRETLL